MIVDVQGSAKVVVIVVSEKRVVEINGKNFILKALEGFDESEAVELDGSYDIVEGFACQ